MASLTAVQNTGYALMEQWSFVITNAGTSGTRVYLDTDAVLPNSTKEVIPKIGDSWSDDYPDILCISIAVTYLNNSEDCGKKIVCTYAPDFVTMDFEPQSEDDLTRNVSVSGEFISWEPKDDSYYWSGTTPHDPVKQPVFYSISRAGIQMYRVIKDFPAYMFTVMTTTNAVNNEEFLGFPAETVLFTGANCQEFKNRSGQKRWKVELSFSVRSCTGTYIDNEDGWNYSLRETTGTWEKAVTETGDYPIYDVISFDPLFTTDPLGDDENLFEDYPDQ